MEGIFTPAAVWWVSEEQQLPLFVFPGRKAPSRARVRVRACARWNFH